jgi:hypothetical protein
MMPQFDIFSFFSQLFWLFVGFSYLYLLLSFYILPAFAAILKIRAKKLNQLSGSTSGTDITITPVTNSVFFENLSIKLNSNLSFNTSSTSDINLSYNLLVLKNETFLKFNSMLLSDFKIFTLFIGNK